MAAGAIYEFYAELSDYQPAIWRRFQVPGNITMAKLGYILMTMFEMQASHLFCFDVPYEENMKQATLRILPEAEHQGFLEDTELFDPEDENWHIELLDDEVIDNRWRENEKVIEAAETKVKDIFMSSATAVFSYDYGDNWQVDLRVEKVFKDKDLPAKDLPRVLAGEGYGIIENCGGIGGLADVAEAFKKKKGEQYEEYCEWLGLTSLDLQKFDLDDTNFRLKKVPRIYRDIYEYNLEPTQQSMDLLTRQYQKKKKGWGYYPK